MNPNYDWLKIIGVSQAGAIVHDTIIDEMSVNSVAELGIALTVAIVCGMTGMVFRAKNPGDPIDAVWKTCLRYLALSVSIGFVTYALTESLNVGNWMQMGVIGVASYAGQRTFEALWDKVFNKKE